MSFDEFDLFEEESEEDGEEFEEEPKEDGEEFEEYEEFFTGENEKEESENAFVEKPLVVELHNPGLIRGKDYDIKESGPNDVGVYFTKRGISKAKDSIDATITCSGNKVGKVINLKKDGPKGTKGTPIMGCVPPKEDDW